MKYYRGTWPVSARERDDLKLIFHHFVCGGVLISLKRSSSVVYWNVSAVLFGFRRAIFSQRDDRADSVTGQFNLFVVIITPWLNSGCSIVPETPPFPPRGGLTSGLIKKTWSLFSEVPRGSRLSPRRPPGKPFPSSTTFLAINWKCFSLDAFLLGAD